ncbi:16S rRNA (guanine(527)-N(7))-methyltransferase RsmG [Baekduia soli]|uniref:16S rRNA (guanine(527)-N(7))-methyltransferase RsmG n=1 Tax=Baekduia soli TaxID=496014 RepID=UPI001652A80B|nr:RsmG family class I SAM-dependent methyltransferase [Baekduia soli]
MPAAHVQARLQELSVRWALPATAPGQLATLLTELELEPSSVTSVRDPAVAVDVHVADALSGLAVPEVRTAAAIADLGAGGGFPGLALAAALPAARVTLVESVGRKCEFLGRAASAAGLHNVEVRHSRAEEWRDGLGTQDVVTARALASLAVLAEYAAPLLRDGGALVAWKARVAPAEAEAGATAAGIVGLEPRPPVAVEPYAESGRRDLYVYLKVRSTPERFPRRPGMARKRPLAG